MELDRSPTSGPPYLFLYGEELLGYDSGTEREDGNNPIEELASIEGKRCRVDKVKFDGENPKLND